LSCRPASTIPPPGSRGLRIKLGCNNAG
jgi:hypothetical protein